MCSVATSPLSSRKGMQLNIIGSRHQQHSWGSIKGAHMVASHRNKCKQPRPDTDSKPCQELLKGKRGKQEINCLQKSHSTGRQGAHPLSLFWVGSVRVLSCDWTDFIPHRFFFLILDMAWRLSFGYGEWTEVSESLEQCFSTVNCKLWVSNDLFTEVLKTILHIRYLYYNS